MKIHWSKVNTPFVFVPLYINVANIESAAKLNLPCTGLWTLDGEFFVLSDGLKPKFVND